MLSDAKIRAAKARDKAYKLTDSHELYVKNGNIAPLKTTSGEMVPIVQKHLDMVKSLNG